MNISTLHFPTQIEILINGRDFAREKLEIFDELCHHGF
jgi:hypothetical protein